MSFVLDIKKGMRKGNKTILLPKATGTRKHKVYQNYIRLSSVKAKIINCL